MNVFKSSSQHADDFIAWQLLGRKNNGLVIEVGAFDGVHLSNSYGLELIGWDSICIEPNPTFFKYLVGNRPDSININTAVVGDENITEIQFFAEEIGVLSGCNYDEQDIKKRYENRGLPYKQPIEITVPANTLDSIIESTNKRKKIIDVLSIDVEGFEIEVLRGLDLEKHLVNLFIVEANSENEKIALLNYFDQHKNYVFLGNNNQNLFFARRKSITRENLKKLETEGYERLPQAHPLNNDFTLDSKPPKFLKSKEFKKMERKYNFF